MSANRTILSALTLVGLLVSGTALLAGPQASDGSRLGLLQQEENSTGSGSSMKNSDMTQLSTDSMNQTSPYRISHHRHQDHMQ